MIELLVIRHGETDWNAEGRYQGHSDNDVNRQGEIQASVLAARLARDPVAFDRIVASDLKRAIRTAQFIAARTGLEIVADESLRERKVGVFRGLTQHEAQSRFPTEFASFRSDETYVVPEGECKVAFQARANKFLDRVTSDGISRRLIVVTHGGIIDSMVRRIFSIPIAVHLPFSNFNAAINRLIFRDGHWIAATLGDIAHLEELDNRHPVREEKLLD